jgi:hypothetical protein
MAHDRKSQSFNAVIDVFSSYLRSSIEVIWWGVIGVEIRILSNLVLFKIILISKDNLYYKGKSSKYTKQCN